MVTGLVGTNAHIPIAGITVSRPKDLQEKIVHHSALLTAEKVGIPQALPRDSIHCFDDQVGSGYSHPTVGMVEEVRKLFTS